MATRAFSIVLSAYLGAGPVEPRLLVAALGVEDVPSEVYGDAERHRAVVPRIGRLALAGFAGRDARPDANDEFEAAIKACLLGFAGSLSRVPTETVARLRADGLRTWVIVNLWIDCDQMDFRLPPPLCAELGRLDLELYVLSNE